MKQIYILTILLFTFLNLSSQTISDYNLLMVNGTMDANAKTELEALGHTVTIEYSSNLTTSYDYSNYDVIIFMFSSNEPSGMSEILSLNSNNQLGIILMRGDNVANSCDIGSSVNSSNTDFTIENNSHFITQPFSLGTLDLGFVYKSDITTINSGNTILGSVSGKGSLVVSNTYRRVMSPYYGHPTGMPWTSDAGILMDRIIAWAASEQTLSSDENQSIKKVNISPNPSTHFIRLDGLTGKESYRIYDILGKEVKKGILLKNEKIDIQNLNNGLYFIKLDNGLTSKFIKK